MRSVWLCGAAGGFLFGVGNCLAQGQAIRLHTPDATRSRVNAVTPAHQYGQIALQDGSGIPSVWAGSSQSWQALPSPGFATVYGADGDRQVGFSTAGAALWDSEGMHSLQPSWAFGSIAYAISGSQQVGSVVPVGGYPQAMLWSGSAESSILLHPSDWESSHGTSTDGMFQGGYTNGNGVNHAAMWAGSAASHWDLHPSGADSSRILGMAPGEQVGVVNDVQDHAALWRGTAASFVDLNPPGAALSRLTATCGLAQVGVANIGGLNGAGIWFGTAASFVSLHQFLPAGYWQSVATSVAHDGVNFYIGGYANSVVTGQSEAFLWTYPVPGPGAAALLAGAACVAGRRRTRVGKGAA